MENKPINNNANTNNSFFNKNEKNESFFENINNNSSKPMIIEKKFLYFKIINFFVKFIAKTSKRTQTTFF